jgi:hypothetical protein
LFWVPLPLHPVSVLWLTPTHASSSFFNCSMHTIDPLAPQQAFVPLCSSLSSRPGLTTSSLDVNPYLVGSLTSQVFCLYNHEVPKSIQPCVTSPLLTICSNWFKIKENFNFSHSICWYILYDLWNNWQLFF